MTLYMKSTDETTKALKSPSKVVRRILSTAAKHDPMHVLLYPVHMPHKNQREKKLIFTHNRQPLIIHLQFKNPLYTNGTQMITIGFFMQLICFLIQFCYT